MSEEDTEKWNIDTTEKYVGKSSAGISADSYGDKQYLELIRNHYEGTVVLRAWVQTGIQRRASRICMQFTHEQFKALLEAWEGLPKDKAVDHWDEDDCGETEYIPNEWV